MLIIGLSGQAGSGKDTIADYLARRYGFVKFAFSDALYWEVQRAFGLEDQSLLRDRATKEVETPALALEKCLDADFLTALKRTRPVLQEDKPRSPRWVLQNWGTEFRRAQDTNYWIKQAATFVEQMHYLPPYPELRPSLFVECGTRFPNEQGWIRSVGGNIWHVRRDATDTMEDTHTSAVSLPVLPGEREIWNNDSVARLQQGVDLLLSTGAKFVRVEPMLPDEPPLPGGQYYAEQPDGRKMLCNADGTRSIFDDVDE